MLQLHKLEQLIKIDVKWLSLFIIFVLFVVLSINSLTRDVCFSLGLGCSRLDFGDARDPLADLVKLSMAFIPAETLREYACKPPDWHTLFIAYLYDNPYLRPGFTHFHMPPLTTVVLTLIAQLIVWFGPNIVIWTYIILFIVIVFLIQKFHGALLQSSASERLCLSYMMIFSYPALFMFARGNLTSYFTIIFLMFYIITLCANKHRIFGLMCLAAAINMRPNLITLSLVELAVIGSIYKKITSVAIVLAFAGLIGVISYCVAYFEVPGYTFTSFLEHLKIYDELYSRGDLDWSNNFSLFGLSKTIRHLLHLQPLYDAQTYSYLMYLAGIAACSLFYLAMRNSLSLLEAVFLSVAFTSLFTPVFAFYHVIEYLLPLVVFLRLFSSREPLDPTKILIPLVSILCLSALNINQTIVYPVSVFILSVFIIIQALGRGSIRWDSHLGAPLHF